MADSLVVELGSNDGYLLRQFLRRGRPGARDRAGRERRRGGSRGRASRPIVGFFGRGTGRGARGSRTAGATCSSATTSSPRSRTLNDFVGRGEAPAQAGRAAHASSSRICCGLLEGNQFDPIYHEHFSYFSLIPRRRSSRRTGSGGRRRGAADPRRLAAAARPARRAGIAPSDARRRGPRPRTRGGSRRPDGLRVVRRARRASQAGDAEFLIERAGGRQDGRRLRRAGQGEHAPELLRDPDGPARLHGRPQPVQARPVHPRHAHPDPSAGAARRGGPDDVWILPWNLRAEIAEQLAASSATWGGRLVVAIPREVSRSWS